MGLSAFFFSTRTFGSRFSGLCEATVVLTYPRSWMNSKFFLAVHIDVLTSENFTKALPRDFPRMLKLHLVSLCKGLGEGFRNPEYSCLAFHDVKMAARIKYPDSCGLKICF